MMGGGISNCPTVRGFGRAYSYPMVGPDGGYMPGKKVLRGGPR